MIMTFQKLAICICISISSQTLFAESLAEVYELAKLNDPVIQAAEANFNISTAAKEISRASLLPQLRASGSFTNTDTDGTTDGFFNTQSQQRVNQTISSSSNNDRLSLRGDLSQTLFDLPAWYRFKSSAESKRRAAADFDRAKQELILRTSQAYIDVLRSIDNYQTLEAEEKALASQLEQTNQRFEVGLVAITDVHEAQAVQDDVRARLLMSKGNLGIAFEGLRVLTGKEHKSITPFSSQLPVIDPVPTDPNEWVNNALKYNVALASAQSAEKAAEYNAKSRKAEHLPTLTARVSYDDSETDVDEGIGNPFAFDSQSTTVQYGITLDVPIYLGGSISNGRKQAKYELRQATAQRKGTERNLIQTTRSLYLTVATGVAQVKARRQSIISSESALEASKAGYEVGTRNLVDVLVAERNLYQARRDYFNTRYDYIINHLELKQSAGTLGERDLLALQQWMDDSNVIQASDL